MLQLDAPCFKYPNLTYCSIQSFLIRSPAIFSEFSSIGFQLRAPIGWKVHPTLIHCRKENRIGLKSFFIEQYVIFGNLNQGASSCNIRGQRRCVAARPVTLWNGSSVLTVSRSCGFIQHRKWISFSKAPSLQSLSALASLRISQHSLCTKAGTPIEDDYPPLPDYSPHPEPEKTDVFIVQTKGLPWTCTAEDLLRFFSECRIRGGAKGVHLTVNSQGRPNGQAFLEMENELDVRKALEKHREYLGPRYVEVYEVTNIHAEAILKQPIHLPASDGVVRLQGLPFNCTEQDIMMFFAGLDIVIGGITLILDRRGRNTGQAFVKFVSQDHANDALQKDRELIGNRYIEVFTSSDRESKIYLMAAEQPSRKSELDVRQLYQESSHPSPGKSEPGRQLYQESSHPSPRKSEPDRQLYQESSHPSPRKTDLGRQPLSKTGSYYSSAPSVHYVHMRGLPFSATAHNIVQFFYPLALTKILIEYGPDGSQSGEADVYFSCHEDAISAMSRDRAHMGERYIELFLNSVQKTHEG